MADKSAPKLPIKLNINLLNPQGIPQKLPIKFLKWLISYGRLIVIFVEIVVLITFGLRFKYDADLANLKEDISRRVPVLEGLSADEALIRQTQLKLSSIKQTQQENPKWTQITSKISSQLPTSISLTNLAVTRGDNNLGPLQFKLNAQTNLIADLTVFINGLRADSTFKDISLAGINLEQGQIIFTVSGGIK